MKKSIIIGLCATLLLCAEENPFSLGENLQKIDKDQAILLQSLQHVQKRSIDKAPMPKALQAKPATVRPPAVDAIRAKLMKQEAEKTHKIQVQKVRDVNKSIAKSKIPQKSAETKALEIEKIKKAKALEAQQRIAKAKKIREERAVAMRIKKQAEEKRRIEKEKQEALAKEKARLKQKALEKAKVLALQKQKDEKVKQKQERARQAAAKKEKERLLKMAEEKRAKEEEKKIKTAQNPKAKTIADIDVKQEALEKAKAIEQAYLDAIKAVNQ